MIRQSRYLEEILDDAILRHNEGDNGSIKDLMLEVVKEIEADIITMFRDNKEVICQIDFSELEG